MAWVYSDYVTYSYGATRLSEFRLHIQEVSDALTAEMTSGGRSHSTSAIQTYLQTLKDAEPDEAMRCDAAAGTRPAFSRARPRPTP
jgi:hypothetical protein